MYPLLDGKLNEVKKKKKKVCNSHKYHYLFIRDVQ